MMIAMCGLTPVSPALASLGGYAARFASSGFSWRGSLDRTARQVSQTVETVEKVRNGDEMSGNFAQGSVNYSYSREVRGTDGEI
jgi:hypothetical protein